MWRRRYTEDILPIAARQSGSNAHPRPSWRGLLPTVPVCACSSKPPLKRDHHCCNATAKQDYRQHNRNLPCPLSKRTVPELLPRHRRVVDGRGVLKGLVHFAPPPSAWKSASSAQYWGLSHSPIAL